MANKINRTGAFHPLPSQVDLYLLEALLEPTDATYPWNPADEETSAYFQQLEQQFLTPDLLDEELTSRSHTFYSQLDTLWSDISTSENYKCNTELNVVAALQKTLQTSFATYVPQDWIVAITQKAAEIFNSQQLIGEKLVQCALVVLPTWAADDLLVLARPLAYDMRSGEAQNLESVLDVGNHEWSAISEIEKAKVSLAIAHYTLSELNNFQEEA